MPDKLTPPSGFESAEIRQRAAAFVCRIVDAIKTDPRRTESLTRSKIAQDVIDDKIVLSSLVFVKDIEPYQPDLISQRVEGVTGDVCGGYHGQEPFFVAKGGPDDEQREAREHDTHLALVADNFPTKIWEIGRSTAIWARGAFHTTYETEYYGQSYGGKAQTKEIEFSGPRDRVIKPEDFFPYPTWETDLHKMRAVGHRFRQARYDIMACQAAGTYFDDVEIGHGTSEPDHSSESSDDDAPEMYHFIIGLRAGDFLKDGDDFMAAEDLEDAKKRPMVAFRVVVLYEPCAMLLIKEYDLPECEYFSPTMTRDTGEFYPTHSIASKGLSAQTLYNDAVTGDVLSVVAAAKVPVLASGFVSDMDTIDIGLGTLIGFRGNPQFFSPPIRANAGQAMGAIADRMERVADGAMGRSQVLGGQLPDPDQTATATAGAIQGGEKRSENHADLFNAEIARSVRFKNLLIHRNWPDFAKFHGDKLWTRSRADWARRYEFGANGQGPSNNPEATRQKIELFVDSAMKIGTKFAEDLDPNQGQTALSREKVLLGMYEVLDFSQDFRDAIVRLQPPPVQGGEDGAGGDGLGGFPGGDPGLPADGMVGPLGGVPPELLEELLGASLNGQAEADSLEPMPVL